MGIEREQTVEGKLHVARGEENIANRRSGRIRKQNQMLKDFVWSGTNIQGPVRIG